MKKLFERHPVLIILVLLVIFAVIGDIIILKPLNKILKQYTIEYEEVPAEVRE